MASQFFHFNFRSSARIRTSLAIALIVPWALLAWSPGTCLAGAKEPLIYVSADGPSQKVPPNLVTAVEQVSGQTIPAVVHIQVTETAGGPEPLLSFRAESPLPPVLRHPQHAEKVQTRAEGPRHRHDHG